MTNQEYKELNYYINIVLRKMDERDDFITINFDNAIELCSKYIKSIDDNNPNNNDEKKINIKFEYETEFERKLQKESENIKLSFEDIFLLGREIIEKIDINYLKKYDELIKTGIIDFSYDKKYRDSHVFSKMNNNEEVKEININRCFSYKDVDTLIHEFIHYTKKSMNETTNAYILHEFISIYFELYAIDYLYDKGIDTSLLDINERITTTKIKAERFCEYAPILNVFKLAGDVNLNTPSFLEEYGINIEQDIFEKICKKMLNYFKSIEKEYEIDILYEKEFNQNEFESRISEMFKLDYKYIFGIIFAFYARKNCDMNRIVELNNHINDVNYYNLGLIDVLDSVGIYLNSEDFIDKAFDAIKEYIHKYNKNEIGKKHE